jgi:hypothetical protein
MNRRFEHRPGLFGLASVAAGCAAKDGKVRIQGDSTSADGHSKIKTQLQSEPEKGKSFQSVKQKHNGQ